MKKIIANSDCIILCLERNETQQSVTPMNDAQILAKIARAVGSSPQLGWMGAVNMAHEVWFYNPNFNRFEMFKNKGGCQFIRTLLGERGINIKTIAATIPDATPTELGFVDEKDQFLFNLKFL